MMKRIPILLILLVLATSTVYAGNDITIRGKHTIEGISSGTRTYILADKGGQVVKKMTCPVNESFSFDLNFTEPGNYEYTVYEEPISSEELIQDRTVYEVQIAIMRVGEPVLVIKGPNGKVDEMSFTDKYTPRSTVRPPTTQNSDPIKLTPTDTEKESKTDKADSGIVRTGDSTDIIAYICVMAIAVALLIVLIFRRKKR